MDTINLPLGPVVIEFINNIIDQRAHINHNHSSLRTLGIYLMKLWFKIVDNTLITFRACTMYFVNNNTIKSFGSYCFIIITPHHLHCRKYMGSIIFFTLPDTNSNVIRYIIINRSKTCHCLFCYLFCCAPKNRILFGSFHASQGCCISFLFPSP